MAPEITVVKDVKSEREDEEKVEGVAGAEVPVWVQELAKVDLTNEKLWRFNLLSNLTALRMAVEDLVVEFQKAPVQRVMNMQIPPELELQARQQMERMLSGKNGGKR